MMTWPLSSGLEAGEWHWPESQRVVLVLDGVSVPGLPRRLYEWSQGHLDAEWLYVGTPWESVKAVSPWLIDMPSYGDPVLQRFLEDGAYEEWGYLVVTQATLLELTEHMQWLAQARHSSGQTQLLRLADPAVIRAILPGDSDATLAPWGPIDRLIAPDAIGECWRTWSQSETTAREPVQSIPSPAEDYSLDEPTLRRLQACDQRTDMRRLARYIEQYLGDWQETWHANSEKQRFARIHAIVGQAREHGFFSLREWALLCALLARHGLATLDDPSLPDEIRHCLVPSSTVTGIQRLEEALADSITQKTTHEA